jgi:hypothetical protein
MILKMFATYFKRIIQIFSVTIKLKKTRTFIILCFLLLVFCLCLIFTRFPANYTYTTEMENKRMKHFSCTHSQTHEISNPSLLQYKSKFFDQSCKKLKLYARLSYDLNVLHRNSLFKFT